MNHGQTNLIPCMGGWCAKREHCENYHAPSDDHPIERLCDEGRDGASWYPVVALAGSPSVSQEPTA